MVCLEQNILLQGDTCHLVILDQHVLPDSFNRILLLGTWQGCKIDLSKRAFSKLANGDSKLNVAMKEQPKVIITKAM